VPPPSQRSGFTERKGKEKKLNRRKAEGQVAQMEGKGERARGNRSMKRQGTQKDCNHILNRQLKETTKEREKWK